MDMFSLFRPLLFRFEPEAAHDMVMRLLKAGFGKQKPVKDASLVSTVFGKVFDNPLGLAAGFDKDAEALRPLLDMGFGFVEAGTVTPRAQAGNNMPRIFRDVGNRSIINRMGFPGKGFGHFERNMQKFRKANKDGAAKDATLKIGMIGINVGINKITTAPLDDYRQGIRKFEKYADYIVINVSSPNTPGLRDLQNREELDKLLAALSHLRYNVPLLLKIAPDLTPVQCADIAAVAMTHKIDGLVVCNTTITRPDGLAENLKTEKGGLSGALIKDRATEMIALMYQLTEGKMPIIGVGGISSAEDAYEKIRAGASLVQIYSGLIYEGPMLVSRILNGLVELLARDGFANVAAAVGSSQVILKKAG